MDEYVNVTKLLEAAKGTDAYFRIKGILSGLSASDMVEIVRCGKCKHSKPIDRTQAPFRYYKPECIMCYCEELIGDEPMVYLPTHFCSFGEKSEGGDS